MGRGGSGTAADAAAAGEPNGSGIGVGVGRKPTGSGAGAVFAPDSTSGEVIGGRTRRCVASAGPSGARIRITSSASPTTILSPSERPVVPSTRLPLTKVPLLEPRSFSRTTPGSTTRMACWRETVLSAIWTGAERLRPMTDSPIASSTGALPGTSTKTCQPLALTEPS